MKRTRLMTALLTLVIMGCSVVWAQDAKPKAAPKPQPSPKASVMQRVGADTDITVSYNRPGVKGRKIWGDLVPYGLAPANQYAKNPFPWRGGANETTVIEFSKPVKIKGNALPAGKYGLHFIPTEKDWTMIFSKNTSSWGSFAYDQAEDALRITVTPAKAPFKEWLEYGFENITDNGATGYLHWEELKVPFQITVD
jgi:hypothetical protein